MGDNENATSVQLALRLKSLKWLKPNNQIIMFKKIKKNCLTRIVLTFLFTFQS